MTTWEEFVTEQLESGAVPAGDGDAPRIGSFGDLREEYAALGDGAALVDRSDRGLLEISGADRASWLHNLTTNEVKNLSPGEGNYAFVVNLQGRILLDVNVIVRPESIWVDLDRRFLPTATAHFSKYIIVEDVSLADRTEEHVRFGLCGAGAKRVLADLDAPHAANMAWYATAELSWNGRTIQLIRHDFCGPFGVELLVPADAAVEFWEWMRQRHDTQKVVPAGHGAVQVRRIEAGIPWPFYEITEEYLPAETGQFSRAVSFRKGCYLGQEVVERMRSRGVVARRLVGLTISEGRNPPKGAAVLAEDKKAIGVVTSSCHSIALDRPVALAYVKTAASEAGTRLRIDAQGQSYGGVVTALPFVSMNCESATRE